MWKYIASWKALHFSQNNILIKKRRTAAAVGSLDEQIKLICRFAMLTYVTISIALLGISYWYYSGNVHNQLENNTKQKTTLFAKQINRLRTIVNNTATSISHLQNKQETQELLKNSAFLLMKDLEENSASIIQLIDCENNYTVGIFGQRNIRPDLCNKINPSMLSEGDFAYFDWRQKDIDSRVYVGTSIQDNKYLYAAMPIANLIKMAVDDNWISISKLIPATQLNAKQKNNSWLMAVFVSELGNNLALISYVQNKDFYKVYWQWLSPYLLLFGLFSALLVVCIKVLAKNIAAAAAAMEHNMRIVNIANQELGVLKAELIKRQTQAMLAAEDNIMMLKEIYDNNSVTITAQYAKAILTKIEQFLALIPSAEAEVNEEVTLASITNAAIHVLGKAIYDMNIKVTQQIPASLGTNADALLLKYALVSIISNLLANASKTEGYILLGAKQDTDKEGVIIFIEDNSFKAPAKPHVKDDFFLTIKEVEKMVMKMGWDMQMEYIMYQGNKIKLFIPENANTAENIDIKEEKYDNVVRLY